MARLSQHDDPVRRSGVVLLIVMAMLALFAVVGLSFVFYAESESDASRFRRQAEGGDGSDILSEKLLTYALGQLIFDTNNPKSKMHGHSLGRSIHGSVGGTIPFNGVGRPHPDTQTQLAALTPFDGINVPYTYPDLNNPFLATMDATGNIFARSFYRNGSSLRPASLPPTNPQDPGEGDVRSWDSFHSVRATYFNDAFWMDLDFPILTAKDGTRYKPLFAFTVLDLDSRLNLAVAGNFQADYTGQGVTSRCGLGTFEINPAKVLTGNRLEIAKLFRGSTTAPSRLGSAATDIPDQVAGLSFPPTKFYSRIDYSGTSSDAPRQPAPLSQFPTFGGWTDPPAGTPHAAGFDYFNSRTLVHPSNDVRLAPSNAEAILRWRDRGSPALTSDLYRLLNDNLNTQHSGATQILNRITPYSMSLDTAHLTPFIIGNDKGGQHRYQIQDGPEAAIVINPHPTINLLTQDIPTQAAATAGVGDDFSANFRGRAAAELRRLNLNRGMGDMKDRLAMAKDIFDRLVRVTGAKAPAPAEPLFQLQQANPNDPEYKATRWLAQLAVNMVDFMDDDDNNLTVFCWNPKSDPKTQEAGDYVVGIEMNRLLINEVYATIDNDKFDVEQPGAPMGASKYRINVWAELYNPMSKAVTGISGPGRTDLIQSGMPRYRLLLASGNPGIVMRSIVDSPTGLPAKLHYTDRDATKGVDDWPPNNGFVLPGDQSGSGAGYYLVAPPDDTLLADRKPTWGGVQWDHTTPAMSSQSYNLPRQGPPNESVSLVLQRLADVTRDEQPNPKQPNYNPFVTVDVFPGVMPHDSLKFLLGGAVRRNLPERLSTFAAKGRMQPLQATGTQDQSTPQNGTQPKHTFGRKNSPLKMPFSPLYHLDRPLISSAEILSAPAVPPSQLTQRFPGSYSVFEDCKDTNSLLYRFLETVTVGDRMFNHQLNIHNRTGGLGEQPGRPLPPSLPAGAGLPAVFVPGKININLCDKKLIEALFDRQNNSFFTDAHVDRFWSDLKAIRDTRAIAGFSDYTLAPPDKAGNMKITMHNTFFESSGFNQLQETQELKQGLFQKMFQSSNAASEYEKTESLRKVMNNITFTSNVFAVWVTVGFFEVDAANQVTQEIGKSENRHLRHRMFAIVDRSQLVLPDQQLTTLTASPDKMTPAITVAATSGAYSPNFSSPRAPAKVDYPNWNLAAGMPLTIDKDRPTEETVTVKRVSGTTITVFQPLRFDHSAGATIYLAGIRGPQVPINAAAASTGVSYMLGYPGPQPHFNMREYTYVVPYYSIID
jgi:hypothetical protein